MHSRHTTDCLVVMYEYRNNLYSLFQLSNRLQETFALIEDLDGLKDELYPLARRAAMLYAITRSLQAVHHEYQFSMAYFIALFDEAVGGELPDEFSQGVQPDEVSSCFTFHTCFQGILIILLSMNEAAS